ncbi:MAG: hypothetical protein AAB446_00650 [Patescibacteria group bacterium]
MKGEFMFLNKFKFNFKFIGRSKKQVEEFVPRIYRPRHRCPYYGFYSSFGAMMDINVDGCAFMTNSFSPCQLKRSEKIPNWINCSFNNGKDLSEDENKIRVFPKEFFPKDQNSWMGITLSEWKDYIMKDLILKP